MGFVGFEKGILERAVMGALRYGYQKLSDDTGENIARVCQTYLKNLIGWLRCCGFCDSGVW